MHVLIACTMFIYCLICHPLIRVFFFFNDTATTEIYTLSLHDALPIFMLIILLRAPGRLRMLAEIPARAGKLLQCMTQPDRKSTRLNSSHSQISYAVFCLKKKKDYCSLPYSLNLVLQHA